MKAEKWLIALGAITVVLVSAIQLTVPYHVSPTIIRGDGIGYYAWLRSPLIDGDLDFQNEYEHFEQLLPAAESPMTTRLLNHPRTPNGYIPNHWPVGPPIMWSPFILVGHAFARISGSDVDTDADAHAYGLPYQIAISVASATYGLAGLWLLFCVLRRYFETEVSALTVIALWGATPLTGYLNFMPAMSHAASFFAVSLIVYLWMRLRDHPTTTHFLAISAACGLALMMRLQDALFGLIPGVAWLGTIRDSNNSPVKSARLLACIVLGGLLACLPQLIAWQIQEGIPLPGDYADSTINWSGSHLMPVLFSPRYGLLTSTPLVTIGLAGLAWFWRRDRQLVAVLGFVLLCQIWVISSFTYFHSGAAFGPRYFITSLPLVAFGFATVLTMLGSRLSMWWPRALVALLIGWNYVFLAMYGLMYIPRSGVISWEVYFSGLASLAGRLIG